MKYRNLDIAFTTRTFSLLIQIELKLSFRAIQQQIKFYLNFLEFI